MHLHVASNKGDQKPTKERTEKTGTHNSHCLHYYIINLSGDR